MKNINLKNNTNALILTNSNTLLVIPNSPQDIPEFLKNETTILDIKKQYLVQLTLI